MKKALDYYYLVLIKGGALNNKAAGVMCTTFMFNVFSLIIWLAPSIIPNLVFYVVFLVMGIIIYSLLDRFCTKERAAKLKEDSEKMDPDSFDRVQITVVLYIIFTIAFFVFALWFSKNYSWNEISWK